MKRVAKTQLGPDRAGQSFLDFLTDRYTYHSREEWASFIVSGRVRLNGSPASGDATLMTGDSIEYTPPSTVEPEVCTDLVVVYEDDHLLVINKPAKLPCHPAGKYFQNTLWALLRDGYGLETVRFVNRLDRETSGLVLVAKTSSVARGFMGGGKGVPIEKTYCVFVEGNFPAEELIAEGWLIPDLRSPVRKKRRFVRQLDIEMSSAGRIEACRTDFRTLRRTGDVSFLEARLITGRTHQIRATLLGLGFPVVGDKLYGVDDTIFLRFIEGILTDEDRARLRVSHQALHAWRMCLIHPVTGEKITLEAEFPPDLTRLIRE